MHEFENILLTRVRLSAYFWFFFGLFLVLSFVIPAYPFEAGALTLFSVNSFLYGFYISPILNAQKARIDSLHQIVRAEANALFGLMLETKKLSKTIRTEVQALVTLYVHSKVGKVGANSGEKQYEKLISFCLSYKGQEKDGIETILKGLVANQKNRTDFNMQANNKVYANEWQIMAILFGITLGFVMTLSVADTIVMHVVRALLCTGLTMLIVILIKLNTLTHKRAKQMWQPLQKLLSTRFYQID